MNFRTIAFWLIPALTLPAILTGNSSTYKNTIELSHAERAVDYFIDWVTQEAPIHSTFINFNCGSVFAGTMPQIPVQKRRWGKLLSKNTPGDLAIASFEMESWVLDTYPVFANRVPGALVNLRRQLTANAPDGARQRAGFDLSRSFEDEKQQLIPVTAAILATREGAIEPWRHPLTPVVEMSPEIMAKQLWGGVYEQTDDLVTEPSLNPSRAKKYLELLFGTTESQRRLLRPSINRIEQLIGKTSL